MKQFTKQFVRRIVAVRAQLTQFSVGSICAILLVGGLSACGSSSSASSSGPSQGSSSSALGPAAGLVPDSLKNKTVKVVVLEDYPPLGYKDNGKLVGVTPELVNAIAADTGLKIQIETSGFDNIIPGMQAQRWDFAAPTFRVSDARLKTLDLVTVSQTYTAFIVRSGSGISLQKNSDACGHTAAVQDGDDAKLLAEMNKQCLQDGKPGITVSTFSSANQVLLSLSSSRVDFVATGASQVGTIIPQSDGKFAAEPLRLNPYNAGIGFSKGSEFGPIVLQALKDLIANGKYHEIYSKYNVAATEISNPELLK